MATINLTVYGHEITCTNEEKPVLSQGSHNIDTVIFTYDSTYSGYTLYATMYQSMSDPVLVELSNNSCKIPIDALLYPGKVRIGLRAEDSLGSVIATSCLEWFNVEPGAIDGSEGTSTSGIASLTNRIAALESAISGGSVPTNVRQALFTLLNNAIYRDTDLQDEKSIIQSWATEITAISVSPATLSISGSTPSTITAVTSPAGGSVVWSSSNTSVATVNGGVVTGVSNGTCTITASCGGKSATCAVTVSGFATLLSISAVYTQSGTVYDTDTLDSLKSDLVVTANYDDSTTATVTDYTLSGTLTIGTSTITVTYGGKTTTFSVTVSDNRTLLYNWDLTSSLIDTVQGAEATLIGNSTTPTQSNSGVRFTGAGQGIYFGNLGGMKGKTLEYDVASADFKGDTQYHIRQVLFANSTYSGAYGTSPLVRRTGVGWSAYGFDAASGSTRSWIDDAYSGLDGSDSEVLNFMSGKTVKFVFNSNASSVDIYADGEHIGTASRYYDQRIPYVYFGSLVSGAASKGDQCYDLTLTGLRVYQNA